MLHFQSLAYAACSTLLFAGIGCGNDSGAEHSRDASVGIVSDAGTNDDADVTTDVLSCHSTPIVPPTLPSYIPGYLELDPATGLHITGDFQVIDASTWHLKVTGRVDHPLSLSYDDLRCLPKTTREITIVCRGFFEDTAKFSGVQLSTLLDLAGVQAGADTLLLKGADDYSSEVPLESAGFEDNLIAYEWEGQPLPILHGYPARALFPQMPGSASVKWLLEIEVITAH
jgi:DMSO/TMAO reductase YedYZ molybdopterin-dependent catalytic subunit